MTFYSELRDVLRIKALETVYTPNRPPQSLAGQDELYEVALQTIGRDQPITILEFGPTGNITVEDAAEQFAHPGTRYVAFRERIQSLLPTFLQSLNGGDPSVYFVHYNTREYSSTLFALCSLWPRVPEYFFIMSDFATNDIVALADFSSAYPVAIEFFAQTNGNRNTTAPQQVFGRLRRVELKV